MPKKKVSPAVNPLLVPCPFCGNRNDRQKELVVIPEHRSFVKCAVCGSTGPVTYFFTESVKLWNSQKVS